MLNIRTLLLFVVLCFCVETSQAKYRIAGFVCDKQTSERLIGANVIEAGTANGTATDNSGYFSLVTNTPEINISFVGYKQQAMTFSRDTLVTIFLEAGEELGEVTVVANIPRFNVSTLSRAEMKNIPVIGGKPDVIKALQLLPGIQPQHEGSSLMNVRGGSPGENLYLIDNVPLIYVNHLGGFMSVFDPEMINNIEVYKGGFPARYGGKLSSIVNITQREGNRSAMKGTFSLGITDASFSIEGPLLDKKASFIVTGRKTLTEPLMLFGTALSDQKNYMYYGFHDINGKFSWHPNEKNHLYVNIYQGDDYIRYWNKDYKRDREKNETNYLWGNWMASVRWNSMLSPRLLTDNTLSYTRYRLENATSFTPLDDSLSQSYTNRYFSTVNDFSFRSDWKYKPGKDWSVDFGMKASLNQFIPTKSELSKYKVQKEYEIIRPIEIDAYCSNRISLFNRLNADIGLRLVNYRLQTYSDWSLEPRVDLNFTLAHGHVLNFTWHEVKQYAHLVMTAGNIFNNEAWIPADDEISPSRSGQYSLGWKGTFLRSFDFETNIYFKKLNDLVTYKEGYSSLLGDGSWRSKVETNGNGASKGIELLVKKTEGKWTGFIAYTYSETTRQFANINGGREYMYDFDRPHSFAINIHRELNVKWNFNLSWTYQTGLPYTPVLGRQIVMRLGKEIYYSEAHIYGERNSERMKDYHRLDVGFTYKTRTRWGDRVEWNFSVYNLYNRHNPGYYFYGYGEKGTGHYDPFNYKPLGLFQTSFFPIIPSVSYKVYYGDRPKGAKKKKAGLFQKIKDYLNYEYE